MTTTRERVKLNRTCQQDLKPKRRTNYKKEGKEDVKRITRGRMGNVRKVRDYKPNTTCQQVGGGVDVLNVMNRGQL